MTISRRSVIASLSALSAVGLPARHALAQGYPERTIRFIVPFAAGGNADIVGRIVADFLSRAIGQPVIVDNRAGAGGGVGAEFAARATPDGYTLLVASNGPMTVNPFFNPNLPYDPLVDFVPIMLTSYVPHVPIVSAKLDVKTIPDLLKLAKTRPVNLGSSGVGSASHMTFERFKKATGADLTHVPYKSGGALLPDVISGNVDGGMTELSTALELHKAGQVRIIGIASTGRSKLVPDVATFDEQGIKGFLAQSFIGLVAPAKTPAALMEKLRVAIAAGLAPGAPATEKLISLGSEIATADQMTSAGFGAFIKRDYEDMREAAKLAGMSVK
jgi:tripartite-type tricarboxylate transporter receptor subunit TctC